MPELDSSVKNVVNETIAPMGRSMIREFAEKFAKIPGLVKLTLGEPNFNVPEHVKTAAIESIKENKSHYSDQKGFLSLREAISGYLDKQFDLQYDSESEVVVTIGATEAIFDTFAAIINPGDKVIIPTPTFALYIPIVKILGGIPVQVDTTADGFQLTGKHLAKVIEEEGEDKVKALMLNFPGNPTGFVYSKDQLQELVDVVKDKNMYVVSDEIYAELTYSHKHFSMAKLLPGKTILINGLSKSHAMTGYRIGYIAGPKDFVEQANKMHAFTVTAPSNPAQFAAEEALKNGIDDPIAMKKIYQERRDYLVDQLNDMGYETILPEGAFYTFSRIPEKFGLSSIEFADKLATEGLVGVTPGVAFGKGGEGHFRISYAASMEDIQEAMKRLRKFTESL
ncbi:aminotransferase class I/II-fold pyridoxal phosphate-dependent enzyme [Companilactobacillus pabuli]|jgi:Aspartate/tyrosine/aromatic aminotransferase|uniref:Aminotransferase n=1 Tax=Companilactobacillus pabuli TaxID=2714036 RepID=A0A7L7KXD2_9LACO|nr:aminotransferase class I/II-fold pyridoxal phosphate-dependent enzyme [Companilactobacillus pabuli]AKP03518.1 aromatic amino acid aminotransferase [Companilactobacillus farciminis]AKS51823.1 aromatic amino acid aminotransferase [Companilactobacillus farciminis]QMT84450.1 aminotransferase class I/II-fold pyridoxal phosphate-dependent enzyme [Companilactobacillus pabuli]